MKRLILLCSIALISYIIYYDLSAGTLPAPARDAVYASAPGPEETEKTYKELTVQSGESVLMLINRVNQHSIPVPLEEAAEDFERLNPGAEASSIRIGQTYKFPLYE
ncbi:hypothetical protein GKZ89_03385 [Bacillus mangrovi]|uniref:LysM domain-containing protein n=1 Tax=Metabacillus mangrovi TaxID=1491830 RepID=A0A7X2V387_9BACI|nr:hypothetical protein [Metabacillus mangrovi]MTH52437.1 hypothetical protein [Metabacillus mangrovi]